MSSALARLRARTTAMVPPRQPMFHPPALFPRGTAAADSVINFGEHKGKPMGLLPSGYLGQIALHFRNKEYPKPEWARRAQEILDARNARKRAEDQMKKQLVARVEESTQDASVPQVLAQLDSQEVPDPSLVHGLLLRRCIRTRSLEEGTLVHRHIQKSGIRNRFVANLLIQMYGKCGDISMARATFDSVHNPNERTYGIMMSIYVQNSQPLQALRLWEMMESDGVPADPFVVTTVLSACTSLRALEEGKAIHEHLVISNFRSDEYLDTTLLKFYSRCGSIEDAKRVFEGMEKRDQYCWSAMIAGLARNGRSQEALVFYRKMLSEGLQPNAVTYAAVLNACSKIGALEEGRAVHRRILRAGVPQDDVLRDAILDLYLRCGELKTARKIFDAMGDSRNVVSWTFLMAAYVQAGHYNEALKLYESESCTSEANAYTFGTLLAACAGLGDLDRGRKLHSAIVSRGLQSDSTVQSSLLTLYCKCAEPEKGWEIFEGMNPESRNVNAWNSMIAAFAHYGCPQRALQLFKEMDADPNTATLAAVLDACGRLGALRQGKTIHERVSRNLSDELQKHALVGMYANCGSLEEARDVYETMKKKSTASTNVLLAAYSQLGLADDVIGLYREAMQDGVKLDGTSFVRILLAFANDPAGSSRSLECGRYFQSAVRDHSITPGLEHYLSVVAALGRGKKLQAAEELLEAMPFEADPSSWMVLVRACKVHGELDLMEKIAAKGKLTLDPRLELDSGITHVSFVEGHDGEVHRFMTSSDGQRDGPRLEEVRALLLGILRPSEDVEDGAIDSEVLAIGYNLLTSGEEDELEDEEPEAEVQIKLEAGVEDLEVKLEANDEDEDVKAKNEDGDASHEITRKQRLMVVKNTRISNDSHEALKLISDIVERKFMVRDQSRFHIFDKGLCSCGDFW